ncbi:IDEAL domain-containing protein [Domibacillus iocasae]|uniref:IDEAL domain-containing protein n=1 Tax=Domibacillus iocasae TaxID=1714016 RepID=A0A1E7DQ95_9BACI|nr:IDEAL domain-containing protein [Domibacillus iocasae]OES45252.1 hypothetical protein BA724_04380 [Domibacillus iocasae]
MSEGEWVSVAVGEDIVIGYITTITLYGGQVEIKRVARIKDRKLKWLVPSRALFESYRLEPADSLLNEYQDKTALIDLALLTKDKQWFEELTRPAVEMWSS